MQLGWIDFSKSDRDKVFSVMHLLEEQSAVDELGLGIIRNAFADFFFPGTSTVQTRAKYFFIVPYILIEALSGRYGTEINTILRRIDNEERACRDLLLKTSTDGVIGRLVPHSWVQRTPASIYWNGLKELGILTENVSLSELIRESLIQKTAKKAREYGNRNDDANENEKDDNDAGDITSFHFLNIGKTYRENWRDNLSIELREDEAAFLRERIVVSQRNTLLAYIVNNNIRLDKYGSFSALSEDIIDSVDPEMAEMIMLANDFNDLVNIITTRFNLIVSEGKNKEAVKRWMSISNELERRAAVDLSYLFYKLKLLNHHKLRSFLIDTQEAIHSGNIDRVDQLIIIREVENKHGVARAKTKHAGDYPFDDWIGLDILDYRFTPAKRIIRDIMDVEEKANV